MDELGLTFRQRWATYFTIALTIAALVGGALLRANVENATLPFSDKKTGIAVRYPAAWLLERGIPGSDFVVRAQDTAAMPFKTTLSVSILPFGPNATVSDVTLFLAVKRAQSLSSYRSLGSSLMTLPNGVQATQLRYAYAASESNPFLSSVPMVISASDVIVLTKGQAIIVTYLADAQTFDRNQHYFTEFLRRLEF